MASDEAGFESRASDRLITFADAVVAIAITLLALDLPVPTGNNLHAFWLSLHDNGGSYLAFLVSFVAIAAAWSHHHDVFRYARGTDPRVRQLHLVWLLMIVLIPFGTKLLTVKGNQNLDVHALQWGFYALLQALVSGSLLAMVRRMISHDLLQPGTPPQIEADAGSQSYGPMLGFGLSIPVFFVTEYAWVLWIVLPVLAGQLRRRRSRGDADG